MSGRRFRWTWGVAAPLLVLGSPGLRAERKLINRAGQKVQVVFTRTKVLNGVVMTQAHATGKTPKVPTLIVSGVHHDHEVQPNRNAHCRTILGGTLPEAVDPYTLPDECALAFATHPVTPGSPEPDAKLQPTDIIQKCQVSVAIQLEQAEPASDSKDAPAQAPIMMNLTYDYTSNRAGDIGEILTWGSPTQDGKAVARESAPLKFRWLDKTMTVLVLEPRKGKSGGGRCVVQ
ncbi:MAG: hypothetical protein ABSH53_07700 [Holophaga sp.]